MQDNKKKIDFIDIFVNTYLKVLPIFIVALFLYLFFWIPFGGEHIVSKEGDLYTMHNVEVLKNIELSSTSSSVTYEFVAKKNSDRLSIDLHFNKSGQSANYIRIQSKTYQNLFNSYKQVRISLYDDTANKLVYSDTMGKHFYINNPNITIGAAALLPTIKHHKYRVTIENLPATSSATPEFNSFLLVVGQLAVATL